jgi:hypothetical protein
MHCFSSILIISCPAATICIVRVSPDTLCKSGQVFPWPRIWFHNMYHFLDHITWHNLLVMIIHS